ncbi:hypothetical protein AA0535_2834 [Asaia krungthepensis NRIC 0535]|uniref:Uncharacterized protein n=1 Tax=Asaia krungthepensis NRIC 0535 TaxID=1307925 RepID=A0ABQ0Q6B4_9PROT|nr:hypothetical protein AA0535_2834 [Asaia krungthepensis NRIC 0535]
MTLVQKVEKRRDARHEQRLPVIFALIPIPRTLPEQTVEHQNNASHRSGWDGDKVIRQDVGGHDIPFP